MNLSVLDQVLQLLVWLLALGEFILGLYILSTNAWHSANRHVSALSFIIAANTLAVGLMLDAIDLTQVAWLTALLAAMVPTVQPLILLTTAVLLRPHWLHDRWRWGWRLVYGLIVLPGLLTLADVGLGTRLWYTPLDAQGYGGGFVPLSRYTAGTLGTPLRVAYFYLLPLLLLALALHCLRDKSSPPLARRLAWLLLAPLVISTVAWLGLGDLLDGAVATLVSNTAFALAYAYASLQTISEQRLQRGRLCVRLILFTLGIVLPLLAATVVFVDARAENLLAQEAVENLRTANRSLKANVSVWLDFNVKALQQLVSQPDIISMVPKRQKPVLQAMVAAYPYMYLVSTTDLVGVNVARNDDVAPKDYGDRPWFQGARAGNPLTFQTLVCRTSGEPALVASMPIRGADGKIVGVGMFAIDLTDVAREVQAHRVGERGYVYVVDAQNRALAHPDPAFSAELRDLSAYAPVAALRQGAGEELAFTDEDGVHWKAHAETLDNGWGVIVQQPVAEWQRTLWTFRLFSWAIIGLGAIAMAVAVWVVVRQALRPIDALSEMATAITAGDLARVAPVESEDEIGFLARAFNSMTGQLRGSIGELEERVAERTRALSEERNFVSTVLNTADALVVVLDRQARIIRFNRACERTTGYTFDEVKGRYVWDIFLLPEEREAVQDIFKALLTSALFVQYENYWLDKYGERHLIAWSNAALADDEGEAEYIVATGIDVTERRRTERALQENEERFRDISLNMGDWIWEVDENGVYTYCSEKVQDILGYTSQEIVGKTPFDLMPPDEAERVEQAVREIAGDKPPIKDLENWNLAKDGHRVCLLTNGVPILDEAGNLRGYRGVNKDITGRKQMENARLFDAVTREREMARILLDSGEALSQTLRLDQLLERILDELRWVVSYDVASIGLRYGERYQVVASRGPQRFSRDQQEHILAESPLLQRVVRERHPVVIPDVRDEADWIPVEGLDEVHSWLGAPLVARDEVIGVLMVDYHQSGAYDEEAGRLIFAFAHQAALAIENARLYEQTRAQLREVSLLHDISAALSATLDEAQILSYVARSLCGILGVTSVELYDLDEASGIATVVESYVSSEATQDERRSRLGQTYTLGDFPAAAEALAQRRPLPLRLDAPETDPAERVELEARGARATLLLPMATRGRLLSFARLWDSQTARRFTQGEIALGQTLLHQATIALDNARLLEETRERVRQTELLLGVSEAAASTLDGAEVLRHGARAVAKTLGADMAGAYLLDENETVLRPAAGYHVPPDRLQTFLQFRIPLAGHMFVKEAWESRRAVFSDAAAHDPRFDAQTREFFSARSVLLIPMIVRDEIVGSLWAVWWEEARSFTEEELRLAEGIVRQAAIAIHNATLFEETQRRVRELQLLHDVGLTVAARVRLEATLQGAAEALAAELQEPHVALMLLDQENDTLQVKASVGYPPQMINNLCVPLGEGIAGWVAQHGKPALVPDVHLDSRYIEVASDVRSELCVPLAVGEQVIGVLNVESPRHDAFTEDDQRLMSTLASNLAVLIERARLFEQVEAARVELQGQAEELKRANARLQELAQVKGEFLANMSHELRTPLNAILGFAQLMERSSSLSEEHKESVRIINSSGEHLLDLINDVLDMSKIEAGRITLDPNSFDLHHSLDSIQGMVNVPAEKKGLRLDFYRAPDVPRFVRTDERKLRQVLINLLGNAIKFTQEGGVVLRVGFLGVDQASPATSAPRLRFEVEDTGMGIAPEEVGGLFEAFSQTASGKKVQQGTGLGLPISRKFVQMMGGDLTVSSQVGRGSTFGFEIQVELARATEVESAQPTRRVVRLAAGQPDYRILVVDDRVENRLLVRQFLEPVGFIIQEASDGLEAIELHARWQPHLILMDMRMPVLDGYQATQQIKATVQGQATVVIALTASVLEQERSVILSVGCDDHVRKPFREADLFAKLAQHLGVCYVYAEPDRSEEKAEDEQTPVVLSPGVLDALPSDWLAELHNAASRARGDLVLELLARIEAEHAPLARALAQLVDEFRFDKIMSLIGQ